MIKLIIYDRVMHDMHDMGVFISVVDYRGMSDGIKCDRMYPSNRP